MFDDVNLVRWLMGVVALVFMFGGLVFILQRLQHGGRLVPKHNGQLKILDNLTLDPRRKLVLVKHDDQEHLILLGQQKETIVSTRPYQEHTDEKIK